MKRKNIGWAALALTLLLGTGAWASFDSPAGVGFDFPENKSGTSLAGFVTVALRDYDNFDLTAGGFEAVAQLQRKKELHAFRAAYDCSVADPCSICSAGRVDATDGVSIALCLTELIQPEVLDDFALTGDVRLYKASEFVSEVDPNDATVRVVAANVEVTVE